MMNKFVFPLSLASVVALTACSGVNIEDAKYWQRKNASSSLYLQGPKAQQMLHQNIAGCVNEIKELEKLGEIRRAVPANYNSGNELNTRTASQAELDQWDSPERDGYLYAEHSDYHDFETCMDAKGWERVEYLPYKEADRAREDYLDRYVRKKKKTYGDRENVTTLHTYSQNKPPYEDTNE
jgi:hypothetical protein